MAVKDYVVLMKPRVIWLLVLAAVAGYIFATAPRVNATRAVELALVGFLSTGGSAVFNMYYERGIDAQMTRTRSRPIPAGRVKPGNAFIEAIALSILGFILSYVWLGLLPMIFVILGWFFYAIAYTVFLKCRSWANILIGGVAGNAALLAGWTVVRPLDLEALLLSMAIYLWIPAHIWSLVIRAKDDYSRTCIRMLPLEINEDKAMILVAALNIFSNIYMLFLYLYMLSNIIGLVILLITVAWSSYYSVKAIIKPNREIFWQMFKSSSPVLTVFLIIGMVLSIIK
ncbi:heme o synthase [Vulcanisaeta souniana]|uniref:Protoheme IX farnesyltransferase n=1 Tax=Vulcanisaeta souniana JCM 11219 TaxID=1293586 RepID=A0A830DZT2_9CREN|nr:heme o synthase [Vulcanisaeta souniana]BDR92009.1 protoheme IX farnesyltransferase [Vulcanisaeta souniana JCM 11219]GGI68615.1 protoheme IX farnesyltransferase [Vulcanisaeta souniana JCM 11219]